MGYNDIMGTCPLIEERYTMSKIKAEDLITEGGISYAVENIDGTLWGVSNNAEHEIEITDDFVPDAHFPA